MPSSPLAAPAPNATRQAGAEAVGTFILVFFTVGSAVFGTDKIGPLGVALACSLVLLALAYDQARLGLSRQPRRHSRRAAQQRHHHHRGGLDD